jgi:elongation factor 1-alpha
MKSNINLAIVGHIDHGKSTFIGRLLYDAGYMKTYDIKALQAEEGEELDFAHFLDIYREERENAMTMDTTKRFFETDAHRYTIIDSPGHNEFIKNMLSGVSAAQNGIAIVSSLEEEGVQEQTRRHIALLNLFGIKLIAIAINKIELIDYDEEKFNKLVNELKKFLVQVGYDPEKVSFIPVSAKLGENICNKSKKLSWYKGPTIVGCLDLKVVPEPSLNSKPLRFSVQHSDKDNLLVFGRVETGKVNVGDNLVFQPSGINAKVKKIGAFDKLIDEAYSGDSIALSIESSEFDKISRGDIAGTTDSPPKAYRQAIVQVVMPYESKLKVGEELVFRLGTVQTKAIVSEIIKKIRSEDLSFVEDSPLALDQNEIGLIKLTFSEPQVVERYNDVKELGRFLLMDGKMALPGIVSQVSESNINSPKIVCGVSPMTMEHLESLISQKRVSMLRANGAFPLPDFNLLRKHNLPLILDIPGDRKKIRTSELSDEELIDIAIAEKLDFIGLSYVNSPKWVNDVKDKIKIKNSNLKVIAKIETKEAMQNLAPIIAAADMILIDRGDLGTDVGYEKVPFYQDKIIALAKKMGKPVSVATELAISTINNDRPTYADTMQLYSFLRAGVDYIVLAEETTKNKDPLRAVQQVNQILDFAEACF